MTKATEKKLLRHKALKKIVNEQPFLVDEEIAMKGKSFKY